jgi:hypothetical protein
LLNADSAMPCRAAGRAGTKENRAPPAAATAAPVALLAGCAISVGAGLLRHLHSRSCDLARQLTQTRSELQSKSSQLSEVMEELQSTRCAWGRSLLWRRRHTSTLLALWMARDLACCMPPWLLYSTWPDRHGIPCICLIPRAALTCVARARDALAETGHELEAKVATLEAQAAQLEEQQRLLEEARGELGSSRSQMQMIERELQVGWAGGVAGGGGEGRSRGPGRM